MDLQADDDLPVARSRPRSDPLRPPLRSSGGPSGQIGRQRLEFGRLLQPPRRPGTGSPRPTAGRSAAGRAAGRPPTGRPAPRCPGRPARLAGTVNTSFRYIATGSSILSPSWNAAVGAGRRQERVDLLERRLEIVRDPGPHLLRLQVIGVVIAGREHVGADQHPPLAPPRRSLRRGSSRRCRSGPCPRRAGRSACRRSGRGWRTPRPGATM